MSNTDDAQRDTRSAKDIERDLAATREDLEETLEALNSKLDVKARAAAWTKDASERAQVVAKDTAERAQAKAKVLMHERGQELRVAGGAVALAVMAALVRRARRR